MSEGSLPLEQVEFEHVEAVPGRALLRVAGRPTGKPATGAATLLVFGKGDPQRIPALPAPPPPPGLLRTAFTVPNELTESASGYSLELGDGTVMPLPKPTRRRTNRITAPAPPAAGPSAGPADPAVETLRRRLKTEREQRLGAETQADASAAARAATVQRLEAVEEEVSKLRSELRAGHGEVELSRTQANHARAEADAAEGALTQAQAEIELLRSALQERDAHTLRSYDHWEQIAAELSADIDSARLDSATHSQRVGELEQELVELRTELESLRGAGSFEVTDGPADPIELQRQLNRAAIALEQSRKRETAAHTELEALRKQQS